MFSYGQDNRIQFSSLQDVVGIFGQNRIGKSSILDILLYALFDKSSRGSKIADILNRNKDWFSCKINLDIQGQQYLIEKGGKRRGKSIATTLQFYKIKDGQKQKLNLDTKPETYKLISSYVGNFEMFTNTYANLQNGVDGFIYKRQYERKNFLNKLLGIQIFEQLHKMANEDLRQNAIFLKQFSETDYSQLIAQKNIQIQQADYEISLIKQDIKKEQKYLKLKQDNLSKILLSYIKVDTPQISSEQAQRQINKSKQQIQAHKKFERDSLERIKTLTQENENSKKELLDEDKIIKIKEKINQLSSYKDQKSNINSSLSKYKTLLQQSERKQKMLGDLQYDQNCTYCMNNVFVKDAIESKENIKQAQDKISNLQKKLIKVDEQIQRMDKLTALFNQHKNTINKINTTDNNILKLKNNISESKNKMYQVQNKIKLNQSVIQTHKKVQQALDTNKRLKQAQNACRGLMREIQNNIKDKQKEVSNYQIKKFKLNQDIVNLNEQQQQFEQLNNLRQILSLYELATNKNGLPLQMIQMAVPSLQNQTNNILSLISDFKLQFEVTEKDINIDIKYNNLQAIPVDLGSGFERTISDMATRIALTRISNISQTNFIVIDEQLSTLDDNNIQNLDRVFQYLSTIYDYVIMISHI